MAMDVASAVDELKARLRADVHQILLTSLASPGTQKPPAVNLDIGTVEQFLIDNELQCTASVLHAEYASHHNKLPMKNAVNVAAETRPHSHSGSKSAPNTPKKAKKDKMVFEIQNATAAGDMKAVASKLFTILDKKYEKEVSKYLQEMNEKYATQLSKTERRLSHDFEEMRSRFKIENEVRTKQLKSMERDAAVAIECEKMKFEATMFEKQAKLEKWSNELQAKHSSIAAAESKIRGMALDEHETLEKMQQQLDAKEIELQQREWAYGNGLLRDRHKIETEIAQKYSAKLENAFSQLATLRNQIRDLQQVKIECDLLKTENAQLKEQITILECGPGMAHMSKTESEKLEKKFTDMQSKYRQRCTVTKTKQRTLKNKLRTAKKDAKTSHFELLKMMDEMSSTKAHYGKLDDNDIYAIPSRASTPSTVHAAEHALQKLHLTADNLSKQISLHTNKVGLRSPNLMLPNNFQEIQEQPKEPVSPDGEPTNLFTAQPGVELPKVDDAEHSSPEVKKKHVNIEKEDGLEVNPELAKFMELVKSRRLEQNANNDEMKSSQVLPQQRLDDADEMNGKLSAPNSDRDSW